MRGKHSGELHPILFFFSFFFFAPRDVSSQLKGYISQHHFNVLTPQLWGVEIANKHCQCRVLSCQWTPKNYDVKKKKKADFVYVGFIYRQRRRAVTHHRLHPRRWIICKWANILCLPCTLTVFALDHMAMFCFAVKWARNGFIVLSFTLFVHCWIALFSHPLWELMKHDMITCTQMKI